MYKFSCKKSPPVYDNLNVDDPCVVCGRLLENDQGQAVGSCKVCCRRAHRECLDRVLLKSKFYCVDISRPLFDIGIEVNLDGSKALKPKRFDELCLVCGDEYDVNDECSIVCNKENCDYGAHEAYAGLVSQLNGKLLRTRNFMCNDVNYYIKRCEIDILLNGTNAEKGATKKHILRRGNIDPRKYTPKRKRYTSPNITCQYCGELVGINERDHLLAHCSASSVGTPVPSRDYEYAFSKLKRLRRIALGDYPP